MPLARLAVAGLATLARRLRANMPITSTGDDFGRPWAAVGKAGYAVGVGRTGPQWCGPDVLAGLEVFGRTFVLPLAVLDGDRLHR